MTGIYKITNSIDNTKYIGKSKDIKTRIRKHKYRLTHGIHHNRHLQRAWDKYGGDGCLGYKHTEQAKKKMRIRNAGKNNLYSRKIICEGIIFDTMRECANYYNIKEKRRLCISG